MELKSRICSKLITYENSS